MLYLTCTTISYVNLAQYEVSHAKDWVSVDCGTNSIILISAIIRLYCIGPLYTDRLFCCYMLDESICHLQKNQLEGTEGPVPIFPTLFQPPPPPHYPSTFNCYELAGPDLHDVGVVSYRRRCDIMTSHGRRCGLCFVLLLMDRSTSIDLNLTFP